jgi:hypothetical protein
VGGEREREREMHEEHRGREETEKKGGVGNPTEGEEKTKVKRMAEGKELARIWSSETCLWVFPIPSFSWCCPRLRVRDWGTETGWVQWTVSRPDYASLTSWVPREEAALPYWPGTKSLHFKPL